MKREYYSNSISSFLTADPEYVLGQLLINDAFETTDLQKMHGKEKSVYFKLNWPVSLMERLLSSIRFRELVTGLTLYV